MEAGQAEPHNVQKPYMVYHGDSQEVSLFCEIVQMSLSSFELITSRFIVHPCCHSNYAGEETNIYLLFSVLCNLHFSKQVYPFYFHISSILVNIKEVKRNQNPKGFQNY